MAVKMARLLAGEKQLGQQRQACSTWGRQSQQKELACSSTETRLSQCSFEQFVAEMFQQAHADCKRFCSQIKVCTDQWAKLTSDCDTFQMVNGYKLEFIDIQ